MIVAARRCGSHSSTGPIVLLRLLLILSFSQSHFRDSQVALFSSIRNRSFPKIRYLKSLHQKGNPDAAARWLSGRKPGPLIRIAEALPKALKGPAGPTQR